jgi:hypothetical protein
MMMTAYTKNTSKTISAIRRYDDMLLISKNAEETEKIIGEMYDDLESPSSPKNDGLPRPQNPQAGEDNMVDTLFEITQLKKRQNNAQVFLKWFEPMWDALTETERRLLETYKYNNILAGTIGATYYSTRQLNRDRRKALSRLELLLFGE